MKVALALILVLFVGSIAMLMFQENIYSLVGIDGDIQLFQTINNFFHADGVMPVVQGLLVVSGLGLAVLGVSYAGK